MKATIRQYRKHKISIKREEAEYGFRWRYSVKDLNISDIASSFDEAICCAMDEIEDKLKSV